MLIKTMSTSNKRKRPISASSSTGKKARGSKIPRSIGKSLGVPSSNTCVIPLTTQYDFDLTADVKQFFTFDVQNMYVEGNVNVTIPLSGGGEVASVFDLGRIKKVEFTVFPACTGLDYTANTVGTGQQAIPVLYEAFDPVSQGARTLDAIRQVYTCRTALLNKPYRRTVYPRLEGGNGIVDVGVNQKNLFEHMGSSSSQRWRGWQLYVDNQVTNWTYVQVRVVAKVFIEVMMSK